MTESMVDSLDALKTEKRRIQIIFVYFSVATVPSWCWFSFFNNTNLMKKKPSRISEVIFLELTALLLPC